MESVTSNQSSTTSLDYRNSGDHIVPTSLNRPIVQPLPTDSYPNPSVYDDMVIKGPFKSPPIIHCPSIVSTTGPSATVYLSKTGVYHSREDMVSSVHVRSVRAHTEKQVSLYFQGRLMSSKTTVKPKKKKTERQKRCQAQALTARQKAFQCTIQHVVFVFATPRGPLQVRVSDEFWNWTAPNKGYFTNSQFRYFLTAKLPQQGVRFASLLPYNSPLFHAHLLSYVSLCFGYTLKWRFKKAAVWSCSLRPLTNKAHPKMFKCIEHPFAQLIYRACKTCAFPDFIGRCFKTYQNTLPLAPSAYIMPSMELTVSLLGAERFTVVAQAQGLLSMSKSFLSKWLLRSGIREMARTIWEMLTAFAYDLMEKLRAACGWVIDRFDDVRQAIGAVVEVIARALKGQPLNRIKAWLTSAAVDNPEVVSLEIVGDAESFSDTASIVVLLASNIAAFASGTSTFNPSTWVPDFMRTLSAIRHGGGMLTDLGSRCADFLYYKVMGVHLIEIEQLREQINNWAKDLTTYEREIAHAISRSGAIPSSILPKVTQIHFALREAAIRTASTKDNPNMLPLYNLVQELTSRCVLVEAQTRTRIAPVVVYLYGAPAVGKTATARAIPALVLDRFAELCSQARKENPYRLVDKRTCLKTFSCTKSQEYFEGYGNQFAVLLEELYSSRHKEVNAEWSTLLQSWADSTAINLNMAFGDKGKAFFTSSLIICTSNNPNHTIMHTDPVAYRRRITLDLSMTTLGVTPSIHPAMVGQYSLSTEQRKLFGTSLDPCPSIASLGYSKDGVLSTVDLINIIAEELFSRTFNTRMFANVDLNTLRAFRQPRQATVPPAPSRPGSTSSSSSSSSSDEGAGVAGGPSTNPADVETTEVISTSRGGRGGRRARRRAVAGNQAGPSVVPQSETTAETPTDEDPDLTYVAGLWKRSNNVQKRMLRTHDWQPGMMISNKYLRDLTQEQRLRLREIVSSESEVVGTAQNGDKVMYLVTDTGMDVQTTLMPLAHVCFIKNPYFGGIVYGALPTWFGSVPVHEIPTVLLSTLVPNCQEGDEQANLWIINQLMLECCTTTDDYHQPQHFQVFPAQDPPFSIVAFKRGDTFVALKTDFRAEPSMSLLDWPEDMDSCEPDSAAVQGLPVITDQRAKSILDHVRQVKVYYTLDGRKGFVRHEFRPRVPRSPPSPDVMSLIRENILGVETLDGASLGQQEVATSTWEVSQAPFNRNPSKSDITYAKYAENPSMLDKLRFMVANRTFTFQPGRYACTQLRYNVARKEKKYPWWPEFVPNFLTPKKVLYADAQDPSLVRQTRRRFVNKYVPDIVLSVPNTLQPLVDTVAELDNSVAKENLGVTLDVLCRDPYIADALARFGDNVAMQYNFVRNLSHFMFGDVSWSSPPIYTDFSHQGAFGILNAIYNSYYRFSPDVVDYYGVTEAALVFLTHHLKFHSDKAWSDLFKDRFFVLALRIFQLKGGSSEIITKLYEAYISSGMAEILVPEVATSESGANIRSDVIRKRVMRRGVFSAVALAVIASSVVAVRYALRSAGYIDSGEAESEKKNEQTRRSAKHIKKQKRLHDFMKQKMEEKVVGAAEIGGHVERRLRGQTYIVGTSHSPFLGHLILLAPAFAVMNRHVYRQTGSNMRVLPVANMESPIRTISPKEVTVLHEVEHQDLVFLSIPSLVGTYDFVSKAKEYFLTSDQLKHNSGKHVEFLRLVLDTENENPMYEWDRAIGNSLTTNNIKVFQVPDGDNAHVRMMYTIMSGKHAPGYCGLPVTSPHGTSAHIVGIHVGGRDESCFASAITREDVEEAYKSMPTAIAQCSVSFGAPDPTGSFDIIAPPFTSVRSSLATNYTQYQRTAFSDEFIPCGKAPAYLTEEAYQLAHKKRLQVIADTRHVAPEVYDILDENPDFFKEYCDASNVRYRSCVMLSPETALYGNGSYVSKMDFTTARGHRLANAGLDKEDLKDPESDTAKSVIAMVWSFIYLFQRGVFTYMCATDCLKDELRDHERVAARKSRIFYVVDFIDNLLAKMALGDLCCRLKMNLGDGPSAVGVAPGGSIWRIFHDKFFGSEDVVAGDISGNDHIMHPCFIYVICPWLWKFYPEAIVPGFMRDFINWAITATICCIRYNRRVGFYPQSGNPSGGWLTTQFNTWYNFFLHKTCFLFLAREARVEATFEDLTLLLYSDDNVSSSPHKFWTLANFARAARYLFGVTITDPDKGYDFISGLRIGQVEFLSRRFLKHPDFEGFVTAPLRLSSLFPQLFYVKKGAKTMLEQLETNVRNVSYELLEYPYEEAHRYRTLIQKTLHKCGIPIVVPFYNKRETQEHLLHRN